MSPKATLYILFLLLISTSAISQTRSCLMYKVQYEKNGDSSVAMLSRKYYDNQGHLTRVNQIGDREDTAEVTTYAYDSRGNLLQERTREKGQPFKTDNRYRYVYDKDGRILRKDQLQHEPFFLSSVTRFYKDSIVEESYTDTGSLSRRTPPAMFITWLDNRGRKTIVYDIRDKNDTQAVFAYKYLPVQDSTQVLQDAARYYSRNENSTTEVIFFNTIGQNVLMLYFGTHGKPEFVSKTYDASGNVVTEASGNFYGSSPYKFVKYAYDAAGKLTQRIVDNEDEGIATNYSYAHRLLIREDYLYSSRLDHSIVYKYD
jgi:YD repeat-containing protein